MVVGETISLEYKMKKGEEIKYKTIVDSEQSMKEGDQKQEIKSNLVMIMMQRCTDVLQDGTMVIDVVIESGSLKRDGEEEPLPNTGQVISMKMKKNGEMVQTSVDLPFSQPPFPAKSIKKKDTWTGESKVSIPGKTEPIVLTYNYILWDFVKQGKHECAEIKVSCPENKINLAEGVEQVLSATGTTYFAHKAGMLVRSEVETKTDITAPDASIKTHIKVKVELMDHKAESSEIGGQSDFNISK
jgi:hypothetical protein